MTNFLPRVLAFALVCAAALAICALRAAPQVAVRHSQGILHGFLIGRSEDGEAIAAGGLSQIARGERVTVHTELHLKDGSLQDETTVYSQRGRLALVSDHMIQRGPQFKRPMEMTVVRASRRVTVNYADDDGKQQNRDGDNELAAGPGQRNRADFAAGSGCGNAENPRVPGGGRAEAASGEADDYAAGRQAATGFARLDRPGRGTDSREVGGIPV